MRPVAASANSAMICRRDVVVDDDIDSLSVDWSAVVVVVIVVILVGWGRSIHADADVILMMSSNNDTDIADGRDDVDLIIMNSRLLLFDLTGAELM